MSVSAIIASVAVFILLVLVLRARSSVPQLPDPDTATEADMHQLLSAGRKIDAIKVYRRLHGVDLKAAKEAVERLAQELGPLTSK